MSTRILITKARVLFTAHRAFFIITFIALCTRLFLVAHLGEFTWDELFSFTFSQQSWRDSFVYWLAETNPPLHLLLLKMWFLIFPANEFTARVLSVLFGLLALIIFYLLALKTTSKKNAALALIFFAVAFQINIATALARGYSLLILLSLLSNYLFLLIYHFKNEKKNLKISFAVVQILLLFTHYTAVYNLLVQTVFLLIFQRSDIKKYYKLHVIPITLWLLWIIPSLGAKFASDAFGAAWFLSLGKIPLTTRINNLITTIFPLTLNIYLSVIILILIISGIGWRLKKNIASAKPINLFGYLYLLLTIILIIVAQLWHIKFQIIILPYLFIIIAEIINHTPNKIIRTALAILIIGVNLSTIIKYQPKYNWQQTLIIANNTINSSEGIVVGNNLIYKLYLDRYLEKDIPVIYYLSSSVQDINYEIVTQNYLFYLRPDWEINNWYRKNNLSQYKEIFLFQEEQNGTDIKTLLENNDWRLKQTIPIAPVPIINLYWYEKNN